MRSHARFGALAIGAMTLAVLTGTPTNAAPPGSRALVSRIVELAGPTNEPTRAFGINGDGVVVGETAVYSQAYAFRWSEAAGMVTLDLGTARRINDSGVIAGYGPQSGTVPRATVWIDDVPQVIAYGEARDVNRDGHVVGWNYPASGIYSAFLWPGEGAFQDLGTLLGYGYFAGFSQALAVTDDGLVVGWSISAAGVPHAFRWTAFGGMDDLGAPAGLMSVAMDATDKDVVVGGAGKSFDSLSAFAWLQGKQLTALPGLGGARSLALAVNHFTQVVGWSETASGERHAVVWLRGGVVDLGRGEAHDINKDGQIAGWQATADGPRAVVWHLAPAARGRGVMVRR